MYAKHAYTVKGRPHTVEIQTFKFFRAASILFAVMILCSTPIVSKSTTAQTLNQTLVNLLSNSCSGLGGGAGGTFGALNTLCVDSPSAPGAGAAGGGGAGVTPTTAGIVPEIIKKRKDDKEGEGASADSLKLRDNLNVFFSFDGRSEDKDITTFEDGYDSTIYSGTIGVDLEISQNLVIGAGFNYAKQDADFDGGGGFDSDAYGGFVFASFAFQNGIFGDIVGGYTVKNLSITRSATYTNTAGSVTLSGNIAGDPDVDEFHFSASGGYDFAFDNVTIGPRFGLEVRSTNTDAYTETGATGLELRYQDQDNTSVQGRVGVRGSVAVSTNFGVLVPEASMDYIHEFDDDQRLITATLVQDTSNTSVQFQNEAPDRNFFELGVGVVAVLPNGLQPYARFSATVGHDYLDAYGLSAGLRFKF